MVVIAALSCALVFTLAVGEPDHWEYTGEKGQSNWGTSFAGCNGNRQSPISIRIEDTQSSSEPPIEFFNYDLKPINMNMSNNGYTVKVIGTWKNDAAPHVAFNSTEYTFVSLHFHWGKTDEDGSEHVVQGKRSAMEIHLAHKAKDGNTLVISVLFRISSDSNDAPGMLKIVQDLHKVRTIDSNTTISSIALAEMVATDHFMVDFFTYSGSFTTPPCSQPVLWCVGEEQHSITSKQIQEFRQLTGSHGKNLSGNIREVQNINGRIVHHVKLFSKSSICMSERECSHVRLDTFYATCCMMLVIIVI